MTRDTVSSVTSATAATQVNWAILAKIAMNSGTLYANTSNRWIFDGTNTWTPVGGFGGIESVVEESTIFPRALKMWLAAMSSAQLYDPLTENLFNKAVRLYRCVLDPVTLAVVGTPQQCFRGYINKIDITMGDPQRGNFYEVEVESRIRKEAASNFYNRETHDQMLGGVYSGDTIFDYVPLIQGFESKWGSNNQRIGVIGYISGSLRGAGGTSGLPGGG